MFQFLNSQLTSHFCWKTQLETENIILFIHNVNYEKPKRKNIQQESTESVSEGLISPIVVENSCFLDQDVSVAGPSRPKSPRIENSLLESLRASLKEEITSEIQSLLMESQKEMLKLLKPKTGEIIRENTEEETENETLLSNKTCQN